MDKKKKNIPAQSWKIENVSTIRLPEKDIKCDK